MNRLVVGLLAAPMATAIAGCGGSAVIIVQSPRGGVLGLEGDNAQAMADARRLMSESCGGAYTIVGAQRAVSTTYRGRTITEHQLRFLCGLHPDQQAPPSDE